MGAVQVPGLPPISFDGADLRIGLGDAPTVTLSVTSDFYALPLLAVTNAPGTLYFGPGGSGDPEYPVQLLAVQSIEGEPKHLLHVRIAARSLTDWLDAVPDGAAPDITDIYQRGVEEDMPAFLHRLVGGDRYLSDGVEMGLVAPAYCAAVARPGWATNRAFLDIAIQALAWHDPRILGWRAMPKRDGHIVLAIDRRSPLALDDDHWEVDTHETREACGALRVISRGAARELAPLSQSLPALFGDIFPKETTLSPKASIPAVPQFVTLYGRAWLVREVMIRETRVDHVGKKAEPTPDEVVLTLSPPPVPRPTQGPEQSLDAMVKGWADKPEGMVRLVPAVEASWRMAPGGAPDLLARYAMPAQFGGTRGGLYMRPADGDPRLVQVSTGQVPVSWGAPTIRQDGFENDDITLIGNKVAVTTDLGEPKSSLRMAQDKASLTSAKVEISASVTVKGKLDIS